MEATLQTIWKTLSKLGTLLVDRRLWIALLFVVGNVVGVDEWSRNADALAGNIVDAIQGILMSGGALIAVVTLLYSYTKRPPSGLDGTNGAIEKAVQDAIAKYLTK